MEASLHFQALKLSKEERAEQAKKNRIQNSLHPNKPISPGVCRKEKPNETKRKQ